MMGSSLLVTGTEMIKGVIFDLDGVLVTTDELHYRAWKRLADEEDIPFNRDVNQRLRGVSRMASLEILLENATAVYTPQQKAELAKRKNNCYRESLSSITPADVLDGALEMLRALRQRGIKIAIGSSSKNAPLIMERTDLLGEVDEIVDGNDITRSKPDPEVFLLAAERMGLEPSECLVVEDAAAGIEAGLSAGMAVFGIGPPERLARADRIADSLADVTADQLLQGQQRGDIAPLHG